MSELTRSARGSESAVEWWGRLTPRYAARRRRDSWTTEDLRQLRELAAGVASVDAISAALRRTRSAIRNKAGRQGDFSPTPALGIRRIGQWGTIAHRGWSPCLSIATRSGKLLNHLLTTSG